MSDGNLHEGSEIEQIERELYVLTREFEKSSAAHPPNDNAMLEWEQRADQLLRQVQRLNAATGKARISHLVGQFKSRLADTQLAKQRYLANRLERCILVPAFGDASLPHARLPLVAAIHRQLAAVQASVAETLSSPPPTVGAEPASDVPSTDSEEPPTAVEQVLLPTAVAGAGRANSPPHDPAIAHPSTSPSGPQTRSKVAGYQRHSTRLDPIMAVEGRLARANSFSDAQSIALAWLGKKGFRLPSGDADSFEIETRKGHRAVAVGQPGVWALQVETADASLAGRRWRVEMVLVDAMPTPAIAVTLTAISPATEAPPAPSIPGLVTTLIQRIGLLDIEAGEVLNAGPSEIENREALATLVAALQSPRRSRPVVVLSKYQKGEQQTTLLDPDGLAAKLGGLAKVVVLSREMAWALTDVLNRRFAVAGASVRLFRPGFTVDDEPGRHPAWSPTELTSQALTLNGLSGLFLREAAYTSLRALEREDAIPAFERVREQVLRRQIEDARSALPARAIGQEVHVDVPVLEQALRNSEELGKLFEADNYQLREELQRARDERDELRARIFYLEARLQDMQDKLREQTGEASPPFPETWDDLDTWCDQHLGERVAVTNKAIKAAQSSEFLDITFAYEVLWFLAETYVPARRGSTSGSGEKMIAEMARLGIEISGVGRAAVDRRTKDAYCTNYKRERVTLDLHVKRSNTFDPRYIFRLYFHWHQQDQCVVVGWLPSHLDNSLT